MKVCTACTALTALLIAMPIWLAPHDEVAAHGLYAVEETYACGSANNRTGASASWNCCEFFGLPALNAVMSDRPRGLSHYAFALSREKQIGRRFAPSD